jgi:hypothetical protein
MMLTCLALVLVALALSNPKTDAFRAQASPPPEQVATVPLFALENKGYQFLYTIDPGEMAALQNLPDDAWHYVGISCYVMPKKLPGAVEVYRLRKSGGTEGTTILSIGGSSWDYFFYTADKKEADNAANNLGWRLEGIAFYMSPKKMADTIPLNRYYRPAFDNKPGIGIVTDHYPEVFFYTTSNSPVLEGRQMSGFNFQRIEAYVWQQTIMLDAATGLAISTAVNVIKPQPPPPMSVIDQLFSLGCTQDAAKKQITCPSVRGYETCNFYKNRGDLKVSFCTTTADQFAFANMEKDLGSRSCTRFLGRAGEYVCQTLNGAQACKGYLGKKDGLVTKCLSAKQTEMDHDLFQHGCKRFLGREDDYYCKTAEGLQTCNNYRIDGRVKTCRAAEK